MKRTIGFVAGACALILMLAAQPAFAQGGGGGRGGGGMRGMGGFGGQSSPFMLLSRADVRADLKLSTDQTAKLDAVQAKMREEMSAHMENMRSSGGGDFQSMREEMEKMQAKYEKEATAVLTAEQTKRLREIFIQLDRGAALLRPDVQKELGLDETQKKKLSAAREAQQQASRNTMERMRNQEITREELAAANRKALDEFEAAAFGVLTPEQLERFKEMAGKKFEAAPRARGG